MIRWQHVPVVACAAACAAACGRAPTPSSSATTPPVKVTAPVTEAALTTVTLTPEAEKRLGIETAKVERRAVPRTRVVGGEIVAAGGAESVVTAPFAGTLESGGGAVVGSRVRRGAGVMRLVPLAPAERDARIEAERAVAEATGRQEAAAKRAERAERLAADGSGSRRAAEEARAELVVAEAALKAARDRLELASKGVSASGAIELTAPSEGLLRAVHAMPGQKVAAGAPLFEVVRLDTVWLRVPLYAGDVNAVDRTASVRVAPLGSPSETVTAMARPIAAPPSADAASAGVNLFYALENRDAAFKPGERVSVRLPLQSREQALLAPRAALLFDATGGAWVYEAKGGGVFIRRRVSLADMVDDVAVLAQGPAPGTPVVTAGAAELFGTEFGVGK